ncbi:MAG: RluA family pseudouridine synthase [Gammaproteobacteria bacterium]|nr:RluA family pseudouridine synthase [Gammaproteobacteria bacterium]MDH5629333.1 RluA family pseudouridine synthase [Gammaproteobacteria bacterium]
MLIDVLQKMVGNISRQKLKQALKFGAVWLSRNGQTNRIRRAKKELLIDDEVHLYFDENILFTDIKPAELIADENEYSIWNKPSGMFSQGTKWGDHSSICRWIEINKMPDRQCYLVHRLDRATSGLMVVAHSKKIAVSLSRLFEERLVDKRYKAKVLGEYPRDNLPQKIESELEGRKAITVILASYYEENNNFSELTLQIETGRKHQIRRQLAGAGHAVLGDRLYGDNNSDYSGDLALKSCYLGFVCPVSKKRKVYQIE